MTAPDTPPVRALGYDIGGTKITAGVVNEKGVVERQLTAPTPPDTDPSSLLAVIEDLASDLRATHPDVVAVGAGAAGLVEWPSGRIRWAPNNPYRGLELRAHLADLIGLPAVVDNDANTAAWAEFTRGSGSEYENMLFVTVGTGVGGGIVINRNVYRGRHGIAGEIGHIIVNPNGPRCGCGNNGCLEALASGTALDRLVRQAIHDNPEGRLAQLAAEENPPAGRLASTAAAKAIQQPSSCSKRSVRGSAWGSPAWSTRSTSKPSSLAVDSPKPDTCSSHPPSEYSIST